MQTEENKAAEIAAKYLSVTNRNIFLTGKAGTGKTTFLRHMVEKLHKNCVVAAPTGIAAINAGGVTLHSLFQLPFGTYLPIEQLPFNESPRIQINSRKSLLREFQMFGHKRNMIRELELLIIDEVSMLRADTLDAIDTILRHIRRRHSQPFGGLQVLFIGDLLQLPPVVKNAEYEYLNPYYKNLHFFNAKALENNQPIYIELEKVYRQTEQRFIDVLNRLRENRIEKADIELLNSHYIKGFKAKSDEGYVYITTHNHKADKVNRMQLEKLETDTKTFSAKVQGEFPEHAYPIDFDMELKEKAQVMFIKNDYSGDQRYFNGKIGVITKLEDEGIEVSFTDGSDPVLVDVYTWENKRYTLDKSTGIIEEKVVGEFTHYPLKLAWAITVHKSQGLTFEKAIIDVSGAFAPGQVYVALSRLRSLDGLVLSAPFAEHGFGLDAAVEAFAKIKSDSTVLDKELPEAMRYYIKQMLVETFSFEHMQRDIYDHKISYNKTENRSVKQKSMEWANDLLKKADHLKNTADTFTKQINYILHTEKEEFAVKLKDRIVAAKGYFEPLFKEMQDLLKEHIKNQKKLDGTKEYVKELTAVSQTVYSLVLRMNKADLVMVAIVDKSMPDKKKLRETAQLKAAENKVAKSRATAMKTKTKGPKVPKIPTKKISYDLYKEGNDISDIAKIRELKETTIESHLAQYIESGELEVSEFVDESLIKKVLAASKELETFNSAEIREKLGNKVSYGQIRMVLASVRSNESSD